MTKRRVIFPDPDIWTTPKETHMNELDQARAVIDETVIRAQRGEGLDIIALSDNWYGSPITLRQRRPRPQPGPP